MDRCGSVECRSSSLQIADSTEKSWSNVGAMHRKNGMDRGCHCSGKSSQSNDSKRTKVVRIVRAADGQSKISSPVQLCLRSANKTTLHSVTQAKRRPATSERSENTNSRSPEPSSRCANNNHKSLITPMLSADLEPASNGRWPSSHPADGGQRSSPRQRGKEVAEQSATAITAATRRRHSVNTRNQRDQPISVTVSGQGEPHQKLLILECVGDQMNGTLLGSKDKLSGGNGKTTSMNGVVRTVVGSRTTRLNGIDTSRYKTVQITTSLAALGVGQNGCMPVTYPDQAGVTHTDISHAFTSVVVSQSGSVVTCSQPCVTDGSDCDVIKKDGASLVQGQHPTSCNCASSHNEPFPAAGITSKRAACCSHSLRQLDHVQNSTSRSAVARSFTATSSSAASSLANTPSSSTSSLQSLVASSASQAKSSSSKKTQPCSRSSTCNSAAATKTDSKNDSKSQDKDKDQTVKCQWKKCSMVLETSDLMDHIQRQHVNTQTGESFVCLWDGCKVYNKKSCSRQWLERHCVTHSGDKPFRCIFDGCGQRFISSKGLERHVNSHFNATLLAHNRQIRAREDTPSKVQKKKKVRRKTHWKVKKTDFVDSRSMEGIQQGLLASHQAPLGIDCMGHSITFHSMVMGRRHRKPGSCEILLRWVPNNILPDEWVSQSQVAQLEYQTRIMPVLALPPHAIEELGTAPFSAPHRRRKHHRK